MAHDARPTPHEPARSRLADALQSIQDDYSRVHAERNALRCELARVTTLGEPFSPPNPRQLVHTSLTSTQPANRIQNSP